MKPFESFGVLGQRDYGIFLRFNLLKGKYYRVITLAIALLYTALIIALAVIGLNNSNRDLVLTAGILLLCAGMAAYVIKVNVRNICRKHIKAMKGKQHILFGKNGLIFELLYEKEEDNEYTDILYDELDKVYETKAYYYIYVDKRTVLIAAKRNLRIPNSEAREFLQSFIPDKFVICV